MNTVDRLVNELIPYENNPRDNDHAVDAVAASIKRFGFKVPVVIDKDGVIVCGHTRIKAAKKIGLEFVPCVVADDLTPEEIKAFRLADNKVSELADWNFEALDIELLGINEIDMSQFGFADDGDAEEYEQKKREFEERMASGELSEDDEEYQEFLKKFEAKKTTDDCYTPELVYEAVEQFVEEEYGIKRSKFVRPFYPGGDYQKFKYPTGSVVVDNPPFSILSEILKFYKENRVSFFLFAPALTLFSSSSSSSSTALCTGVQITYENGANVSTSFLTNLEDAKIRFKSCPKLHKLVDEANTKTQREKHKQMPKYSYPLHLVTSPMMTIYSRLGIEFSVNVDESFPCSQLDAQKESGKTVFGNGYLISEAKKAEREKAERWELSERELEIIKRLK